MFPYRCTEKLLDSIATGQTPAERRSGKERRDLGDGQRLPGRESQSSCCAFTVVHVSISRTYAVVGFGEASYGYPDNGGLEAARNRLNQKPMELDAVGGFGRNQGRGVSGHDVRSLGKFACAAPVRTLVRLSRGLRCMPATALARDDTDQFEKMRSKVARSAA